MTDLERWRFKRSPCVRSNDSKVDKSNISLVVWHSPYTCALPYHPDRYQATMDSCFGLLAEAGFIQNPLEATLETLMVYDDRKT